MTARTTPVLGAAICAGAFASSVWGRPADGWQHAALTRQSKPPSALTAWALPPMRRILLASVFLVATNAALAGDAVTLGKEEDQYAAGISVVEQVQKIKDRDIGMIRVSSLDNGPAMNPIGVAVSIAAPEDEQGGDHLVLDTYYLGVNFSDVVLAKVVQNDLAISGPATDVGNGTVKPLVIKVRIKRNGKRLPAPVVLP